MHHVLSAACSFYLSLMGWAFLGLLHVTLFVLCFPAWLMMRACSSQACRVDPRLWKLVDSGMSLRIRAGVVV
jgi:hypothetical protein